MSEKKQLNDEELEKVNGGASLRIDDPEYQKYSAMYNRLVDKYDTPNYLGQNVLLTYYHKPATLCAPDFASSNWVYGTLISSYEKDTWWGSERTAVVRVIATYDVYSHSKVGDINDYCLDYWDCWVAN